MNVSMAFKVNSLFFSVSCTWASEGWTRGRRLIQLSWPASRQFHPTSDLLPSRLSFLNIIGQIHISPNWQFIKKLHPFSNENLIKFYIRSILKCFPWMFTKTQSTLKCTPPNTTRLIPTFYQFSNVFHECSPTSDAYWSKCTPSNTKWDSPTNLYLFKPSLT